MGRRHHHQKHFVLFSYKTNLFHFALGLYNDRSQKEVTMYNASSSFFAHFDVICNPLLNRCRVTWNSILVNLFNSQDQIINSPVKLPHISL